MVADKASPVVFGGKLHTAQDVPERIYPEPLREALLILDYVFYILDGGKRPEAPRAVDECHYARLHEISKPSQEDTEYWLALKDAIEPNRRNLNVVFLANGHIDEEKKEGAVKAGEPLGWGVDIHLREDVRELCATHRSQCRRVKLDRLTVEQEAWQYVFGRSLNAGQQLYRHCLRGLAWIERLMGNHSFLTFLIVAFLISDIVTRLLTFAFIRSYTFQTWFFDYQALTIPLVLLLQVVCCSTSWPAAFPPGLITTTGTRTAPTTWEACGG